jgi:putative endonuclease
MIYHVYALRSSKNRKLYVGFTRKPVQTRLKEHNEGKNAWTRNNGPFALLHFERYRSRKEALLREKYLKTGAGRKFLKQFTRVWHFS